MASYSDKERRDFLRKLDESDTKVTDWEAGFIESNLDRGTFTSAQAAAIDRMIEKYPNV